MTLPKRLLDKMKRHPPFHQAVWKACAEIPAGETRTYGWIARRLGRPGAARAVGTALARNPFAPEVPCHRVVRSDGGMGGYSAPGGVARKRRMLRREGALALLPVLAVLSVVSVFSACGAGNKNLVIAPDYGQKAPKRIAVLPFENESMDLNAPPMIRKMARDRVALRGYESPALSEVDAKLSQVGISDGGQLRALKPQALGDTLGSDGLLYGIIEEFAFADAGFGLKKLVRVRLRLVSASTGETVWENVGEAKETDLRMSKDAMKKGFAGSVGEKVLGNMTQKPLYKESSQVIDKLTRTLPIRGR